MKYIIKVINKRSLVSMICLILICSVSTQPVKKKENIDCYIQNIDGGILDISDEEEQPPRGKSIFFHETKCHTKSNFSIAIHPRQACAVESAARLHPDSMVYLLFTSPITYPNNSKKTSRNDRIIRELLKYQNIKIRRLSIDKYTLGTPFEDWEIYDALKKSLYPIFHSSDILRYLSLWKYGGTYMDLDIVVIKNLTELGQNFAAKEGPETVGSGILNFDSHDFGHTLALKCLDEIRYKYHGDRWSGLGPDIITRVLENTCKYRIAHITTYDCIDFKVLKSKTFYPVEYYQWRQYFDELSIDDVITKAEKSYTIHVWNKLSSGRKIITDENPVAYGYYAQQFCPNVYRESGDTF